MRITKTGVVIFTENAVKVEGWLFELEPDDPKDATPEQLLLAYAIHWAQEKFKNALQGATQDLIKKLLAQKKLVSKSKVN